MAVTEDRAGLLRLIAEGQSYEDVASLLGEPSAEVRDRAHAALSDLAGGEPLPGEVADALLGHGSMGALGPGSPVATDAATGAAARRAAAELARIAPEASLPRPAASAAGRGARGPRIMLLAGIGFAAILLAVLAISGVFGGDDAPSAPGGPVDEESEAPIPLEPVGGSKARGEATLIRVEDVPVLSLELRRLEPSGPDRTYIVWLYNSPDQAFPVGFRPVGPDGRIRGIVPVPSAAVALLPEFRSLDVSLAVTDRAVETIRRAERGDGIPSHAGRSVLRGPLRDG